MPKQITINNETINVLEVIQETPSFVACLIQRVNEHGKLGQSYIECFDKSELA